MDRTSVSTQGGLLGEIARCEVMLEAKRGQRNPCSTIVAVQAGAERHHVPEPWNGDIVRAPILFISSNPSINRAERYPDLGWTAEATAEFFAGRFGGDGAPIRNGSQTLRTDGGYGRGVRFLGAVRNRAGELLQRPAVPGVDYAITEVVHCKSAKEQGVKAAAAECVPRYLGRVLELSGARVVVVLGVIAGHAVANHLGIDPSVRVHGPVRTSSGIDRSFGFLPHPSSYGRQRPAADELDRLRALLAS